ncbi:hypothetical protein LBMAG21_06920 [Armatimonadota bacterium]|nr:hypothetical protein LBMAG21_06920 [Armatimonadota bacterium]
MPNLIASMGSTRVDTGARSAEASEAFTSKLCDVAGINRVGITLLEKGSTLQTGMARSNKVLANVISLLNEDVFLPLTGKGHRD